MKTFPLLLAIALLLPGTLPAATPEEVAMSFFNKIKSGDYDGACELFHPSAVKQFADIIDLALEDEDEGEEALTQFFGEKATRESVARMSPMEKFKGMMGTLLRHMEEVKWTKSKVLGTVKEGEDLRHVVVRMAIKLEGVEFEGVDVASMKRIGDGWGIILKAEFAAFIEGMRKKFATEE